MNIETKSINTIRVLAADMVQKANSGHPGAPMGIAPAAYRVRAVQRRREGLQKEEAL